MSKYIIISFFLISNLGCSYSSLNQVEQDIFVYSNTEFPLTLQNRAILVPDSLKIRLLDLDDSRCPSDPNIRCIWAGQVNTTIVFESTGSMDTLNLIMRANLEYLRVDSIDNYRIEIVNVYPEEKQLGGPDLDQYIIFLLVSRL